MIQIGFSTSDSFISKFIRFFSQAEVSHTFIIFDDPTLGGRCVIEAQWDGYHVKSFEAATRGDTKFVCIEPLHPTPGLVQNCVAWLGRSYDYSALVGIWLTMFGRYFKRKWKNPFGSATALFCSEAIVIALRNIGYPRSETLTPNTTTPQDLLSFFRAERN